MEEARLYGKPVKVTGKATDPEPSVMGVNNAKRIAGTDFDWGKSDTSDSGSSDILAFRFSPALDFTDSSSTRQTGMIDCSGNPIYDYSYNHNKIICTLKKAVLKTTRGKIMSDLVLTSDDFAVIVLPTTLDGSNGLNRACLEPSPSDRR